MKKSEASVIWAQEQVAMLQPLLKIQHWRLSVVYDAKLKGAWAEVTMAQERHVAELALSKEFVKDCRTERERVLIHELLHLQHEDAMSLVRHELDDATHRAFWIMEEKAIDDLAVSLHPLIYGAA